MNRPINIMTIYPIELSNYFHKYLEPPTANIDDIICKNEIESTWLKAVLLLEQKNTQTAITLFSSISTGDCLFALSSQIELIFLQPVAYVNNNDLIKNLIKRTKVLPQDRLLARLYHALSILMMWRRNSPQTINYLLKSRDIYLTLNEKTGLARIFDTLGNNYTKIADHQQAIMYYTQSLALKTSIKDSAGLAITFGNLARLSLQMGRYQQATTFLQLDIDLVDDDQPEILARLLTLQARVHIAEENYIEADKTLKKALEILNNCTLSKHSDSIFFCLKEKAIIALLTKNYNESRGFISQCLPLLPIESDYHQIFMLVITFQLDCHEGKIQWQEYNILLNKIQNLELTELEIEFRLFIITFALEQNHHNISEQMLITRKLARSYGLKKFLPKLNSLILTLDIKEHIEEEVTREISETFTNNEDGYFIRQRIGGGGFGDVFLAHDMIHDRDIALKRFQSDNLIDHEKQKQIWIDARIEFEAVAQINHPSIAKIFALGHDNKGSPYLVQEFVPGGDIRDLMKKDSTLISVLRYLTPLAYALSAVHEKGIIHRDLKPENLMINSQGIIVIIDFGIALLKKQHSPANKSKIRGTENYIAPEQKISTNIDHRADIFSLGCILYEWLSQKPTSIIQSSDSISSHFFNLFKDKDIVELDKNICGKAYPLVKSMLAKEPKNRPKNALFIAKEMESLIKELSD
jgi:serine/threonine-protein kinase